jgi:hypothetical protein
MATPGWGEGTSCSPFEGIGSIRLKSASVTSPCCPRPKRIVLKLAGLSSRKVLVSGAETPIKAPPCVGQGNLVSGARSSSREGGNDKSDRRGRVARLVVQKNPALPVVGVDAENFIGKEQNRDARLGLGHWQ